MEITNETIIGSLVAQNYRTAAVFKSHQIDFCCKGNRSIEEVCDAQHIDVDFLIHKLNKVEISSELNPTDFQSLSIDLLADYIEDKHHRYVEKTIPELNSYLQKIARVHGERHPELNEIKQLFTTSSSELLSHMIKEEVVLFPYIRQIAQGTNSTSSQFKSLKNPIQMMMDEHSAEGDRFQKIADLSQNYTTPPDACSTFSVAFAMLNDFENDLHLHMHLENNILFPKAIETEQKLYRA